MISAHANTPAPTTANGTASRLAAAMAFGKRHRCSLLPVTNCFFALCFQLPRAVSVFRGQKFRARKMVNSRDGSSSRAPPTGARRAPKAAAAPPPPRLQAGPGPAAQRRAASPTLPLSRALSLLAAAALSTAPCAGAAPVWAQGFAVGHGPVRPASPGAWCRDLQTGATRGGRLLVADAAGAKSAEQQELDESLAESQMLGPVFIIAKLANNFARSARVARARAGACPGASAQLAWLSARARARARARTGMLAARRESCPVRCTARACLLASVSTRRPCAQLAGDK